MSSRSGDYKKQLEAKGLRPPPSKQSTGKSPSGGTAPRVRDVSTGQRMDVGKSHSSRILTPEYQTRDYQARDPRDDFRTTRLPTNLDPAGTLIRHRRAMAKRRRLLLEATPTGGNGVITFDSGNKSTNISLSGGDLIATASGAQGTWCSAYASGSGVSSGKWYWEIEITTIVTLNTHHLHGCAVSGLNLETQYPGAIAKSIGTAGSGSVYINATGPIPPNGAVIAETDVMMFALDLDNGYYYQGSNGTWANSGDPDNDSNPLRSGVTAGTYFPAIGFYTGAQVATARFAPSDLSYSAPTGYFAYGDDA